MVEPADIEQALVSLTAAGAVEVRENGVRLASLADFNYEVRVQGRGTLLHLWSDERTLARRVLRITEQTAGCLLLEVERFGRAKPDRLEFTSADERPAAQLSREKFRERFAELLREQFPDEEVESLSTAGDLEHSLSTRYTRGLMRSRGVHWPCWPPLPGKAPRR